MNNRKIKFRVWDVLNNKLYTPKCPPETTIENGSEIFANDISMFFEALDELIDYPKKYILQQFTGLLDKNGVEIYEGDIVKAYLPDGKEYISFSIYYFDRYAQFCFGEANSLGWYLNNMYYTFEVIGNIMENPELL